MGRSGKQAFSRLAGSHSPIASRHLLRFTFATQAHESHTDRGFFKGKAPLFPEINNLGGA